MRQFILTYKTTMPVAECVQNILDKPWEYEDKDEMFGRLWYRCEQISETQLHVTFIGGSRRKSKRTKFLLLLEPGDDITKVTLSFLGEFLFGELLRTSIPCTGVKEIDMFMSQRIHANQWPPNQEFKYT